MIRVAALQACPHKSFEDRKKQIFNALAHSENHDVDFLCFPEGFLTGYYEDEHEALKNSFDISDSVFQKWLSETASFRTTFIMGFNEKHEGELFDSAAIIENGRLLGIQRKHYLYHDYFSSSTDFSVFQSKGIPFGVVICLDSNYFEPSRILSLQGACILFIPMCNKVTPSHPFADKPPYYSHFVARAHENRCWLIAADWIWPNDGNLVCPGHSVIYDSDGREMTRSQIGKEEFLTADIPLTRLHKEKGKRVHGSEILGKALSKLQAHA